MAVMTATEGRPMMIVMKKMEWEGIGSAAHNNKSFLLLFVVIILNVII